MSIQGPKQAESEEGDEGGALFSEINITPLTDVILVLLIIFMVSSSAMIDAMREGEINVSLPQASASGRDPPAMESLVIGITEEGQVFVRGQIIEREELEQLLSDTKKSNPKTTVVLQADGGLQHRKVVEILDLIRGKGFADVAIGVDPDAARGESP